MNRIIQSEFIKAALAVVKRSIPKDDESFTYKVIAEDMWRDLWKEATEHFNTNFDWENNESSGERKTIKITHKDEDLDFNYKFNCELFIAGGDWEVPCYYFRCQITDGSFYEDKEKLMFPGMLSAYGTAHFILIPPKDHGNTCLMKNEKGKWMALQNSETRDEDIPELDSKKAWQWVLNYLKSMVKDYVDKRPKL